MTYYHPASPYFVGHYLNLGFLDRKGLVDLEHPQVQSYMRFWHQDRLSEPARTLVFDDPDKALEWWAEAYGTEIVLLQIDGDVTLEENTPPVPEGMFFIEGRIPPEQVSRYEPSSPRP